MTQPIKPTTSFLQLIPNTVNHNYGFKVAYPNKNLKIHYEVALKFETYNDNKYPVYSINRSQVYINNQVPDMLVYEIADEMVKSIYPIHFGVNKNGTILTLENHQEIISRCKKAEKKISNYYEADVAQNIITNFNTQYNNSNSLIYQLQNDLFYNLLFFPLHNQFNKDLKAETIFKLLIEQKEVNLPVFQEIEKHYTDSHKIKVNLLGLNNNDKIIKFKIFYNLYPDNYAISSIVGEIEYELDNEKEIIEFECYHLK